jgi:hypothetical protein
MVLMQLLIHSIVLKTKEGLAALGPRVLQPCASWSRKLRLWARGNRREHGRCECARPVLALAEEEMRGSRQAAESAAAATASAHAAELARAEARLRRAEQPGATAAAERDAARAAEAEARRMTEAQGAAMARAVANASALAEQASSDAENYVTAVREDAARAAAGHRAEMERMGAHVREAMRLVESAAAAQGEAESVAASLRGERAAMEEAQRAAESSSALAVHAVMLAERANAEASVADSELRNAKNELADCRARHEEARAAARRVEEAEATLRASQERARLLSADLISSRRTIAQLNVTISFLAEHSAGPYGKGPFSLAELTAACGAEIPECPPSDRTSAWGVEPLAPNSYTTISTNSNTAVSSDSNKAVSATRHPATPIDSLAETAAAFLTRATELRDAPARKVSPSLRAVPLPPDLARFRDMAVPDLANVDTSAALQPGTPLLLAPLVFLLLFLLCRPLTSRSRRHVSHARQHANDKQRIMEGEAQDPGVVSSGDSVDVDYGTETARRLPTTQGSKPGCAVPRREIHTEAAVNNGWSVGSVHTGGAVYTFRSTELESIQRARVLPAHDEEAPFEDSGRAAHPTSPTSLAVGSHRSLSLSPMAADALSTENIPEYRCVLVATERVRDAWAAYRAFHSWILAAACMDAEETAKRGGWAEAAAGQMVRDLEQKLIRERASFARLATPPGSMRPARSVGLSSAGGRSRRSHATHVSHVSEASAEIAASLRSLWKDLPVLTEPLDGRGQLASTPRRLASVTRRLLPRLAEHASPSRLLSAMLREVSLVVAEEAMRSRHLASCHTREGSSSSTWSANAGGDGMSHSASWGQLTAENVQIHEKRSSPVAIPELLARNGEAEALKPIEDGCDVAVGAHHVNDEVRDGDEAYNESDDGDGAHLGDEAHRADEVFDSDDGDEADGGDETHDSEEADESLEDDEALTDEARDGVDPARYADEARAGGAHSKEWSDPAQGSSWADPAAGSAWGEKNAVGEMRRDATATPVKFRSFCL